MGHHQVASADHVAYAACHGAGGSRPQTRAAIRDSVIEAGLRRIRPCLMTTATTFLVMRGEFGYHCGTRPLEAIAPQRLTATSELGITAPCE